MSLFLKERCQRCIGGTLVQEYDFGTYMFVKKCINCGAAYDLDGKPLDGINLKEYGIKPPPIRGANKFL